MTNELKNPQELSDEEYKLHNLIYQQLQFVTISGMRKDAACENIMALCKDHYEPLLREARKQKDIMETYFKKVEFIQIVEKAMRKIHDRWLIEAIKSFPNDKIDSLPYMTIKNNEDGIIEMLNELKKSGFVIKSLTP